MSNFLTSVFKIIISFHLINCIYAAEVDPDHQICDLEKYQFCLPKTKNILETSILLPNDNVLRNHAKLAYLLIPPVTGHKRYELKNQEAGKLFLKKEDIAILKDLYEIPVISELLGIDFNEFNSLETRSLIKKLGILNFEKYIRSNTRKKLISYFIALELYDFFKSKKISVNKENIIYLTDIIFGFPLVKDHYGFRINKIFTDITSRSEVLQRVEYIILAVAIWQHSDKDRNINLNVKELAKNGLTTKQKELFHKILNNSEYIINYKLAQAESFRLPTQKEIFICQQHESERTKPIFVRTESELLSAISLLKDSIESFPTLKKSINHYCEKNVMSLIKEFNQELAKALELKFQYKKDVSGKWFTRKTKYTYSIHSGTKTWKKTYEQEASKELFQELAYDTLNKDYLLALLRSEVNFHSFLIRPMANIYKDHPLNGSQEELMNKIIQLIHQYAQDKIKENTQTRNQKQIISMSQLINNRLLIKDPPITDLWQSNDGQKNAILTSLTKNMMKINLCHEELNRKKIKEYPRYNINVEKVITPYNRQNTVYSNLLHKLSEKEESMKEFLTHQEESNRCEEILSRVEKEQERLESAFNTN